MRVAMVTLMAIPLFFSSCMQVFRPQHPMRMMLRVFPQVQMVRTGQPACIVITFSDRIPEGIVEVYGEDMVGDWVLEARTTWKGGYGQTPKICKNYTDAYFTQRAVQHEGEYQADRDAEVFGGVGRGGNELRQPIDNQATWDGTVKGQVQYRTMKEVIARRDHTIKLSCPRCTV